MSEIVSMAVPEKLVADIVQRQVAAKVVEALAGQDALVSKIVNVALSLRVDGDGKPSSYSSAKPYIEHICIEAIQSAAKDAMKEYVQTNRDKIKAEVEKQLKKSTSKLVQAFVDTVVERTKEDYRFAVKVEVEQPKSSY